MLKTLIRKITNRKKSILVKSFIMNSALATVVVIALVLLIFFWFQRRSLEDVNNATCLMLNNMEYKTDELLKGSSALAYQLFKSNNCTELMMSSERDITNEIRITSMIDNTMLSMPYLQSIYICNNKRALMRKDRDSYYDTESDGQIFDVIYANSILTPIIRKMPVSKDMHLNLYTIIYHTAYPNNRSLDGAVVVNLNADKVYQYISSKLVPRDSSTFVIDPGGNIVAHRDKSMFMKNLSGEAYIRSILSDPASSGVHYVTLKHEKYAVNFVRSEDTKWIFVSVNPYRIITARLNQSKDFVLIVCLVVLLVLLVSYFLLTVRIFRPVTQIINNIRANSSRLGFPGENSSDSAGEFPRDEFRYISQAFSGVFDYIKLLDRREKDNVYILRNNFVWSLLNECEEQPSVSELEKEFAVRKIDFNLNKPFAVVILRIDGYKDYIRSNSAKSKNLLLFSIGNIACELLGEVYSSFAFETDSDHEILLINLEPSQIEEFGSVIAPKLKNVQENIGIFLKTSVTAAVSDAAEDAGRISALYRQALLYTNYRLTHGPGGLYMRTNVPESGNLPCDREIKEAVQAVKDGSREAFREMFGELLEKARLCHYEKALKLFTDLHAEIMKIPGNLSFKTGVKSESNIIDVYKAVSMMESPAELKDFFEGVFDLVSGKVSSVNQLSAKNLVADAIRYIEENYSDTQISGNSVAKHLSLSPQYFSKVFSDQTGCGFPEYLNHVRLQKAGELLENSDRNAFEIGEMVGYANRSYFSTLFKKEFGVSPSKYRLLKTKKES